MTSKVLDKESKEGIKMTIKERLARLEARDTPMKVVKTPDWYYHCPICEEEIDIGNTSFDCKQIYRYCYHCGQRLDWSDENE